MKDLLAFFGQHIFLIFGCFFALVDLLELAEKIQRYFEIILEKLLFFLRITILPFLIKGYAFYAGLLACLLLVVWPLADALVAVDLGFRSNGWVVATLWYTWYTFLIIFWSFIGLVFLADLFRRLARSKKGVVSSLSLLVVLSELIFSVIV